jgi:hypothetical protein
MKKFLLPVFTLLVCFAQAQIRAASWSIGAGLGVGNYFGDIVPKANDLSTDLQYTRLSPSVDIAYQFTEQFAVELDLAWIRLISSDFETADPRNVRHRYRFIRNLNFRNDIFEIGLTGEWDFKPTIGGVFRRPTWRPYAFAGIAGFYHNPKGMTPDGRWVDLQPLRTEGQGLTSTAVDRNGNPIKYPSKPYSLVQVAIPFGGGIKYRLTDNLDIAFEIGYRFTFTDYLDDVSGNYASAADLNAFNPLSAIMANRTLEPRDPISGKPRDFAPVVESTNGYTVDALGRPTVNGFGNAGDQRGNVRDRDIYIVNTFRVQYFLEQRGVRCPKFRRVRR